MIPVLSTTIFPSSFSVIFPAFRCSLRLCAFARYDLLPLQNPRSIGSCLRLSGARVCRTIFLPLVFTHLAREPELPFMLILREAIRLLTIQWRHVIILIRNFRSREDRHNEMHELERIEKTLRQLADATAAYRKARVASGELGMSDSEQTDITDTLLAAAASEGITGLVSRVVGELGRMITDRQGVRVLIVGTHRTDDDCATCWYEFFSEKEIEMLLQTDLMRVMETLTSVERLRLMLAILSGVTRSADIRKESRLSQGQYYHHLRLLEGAGMVRKKARDQYELTVHGTSSLLTILATTKYIMRRIPFLEVDKEIT